jgi:hypothetical protein
MNLEEYYHDFLCDLEYEREGFREEVFTRKMCDFLVEQAVIEKYEYAGFHKTAKGIKVSAWDYNEDRSELLMILSDFRNSSEIEKIAKKEIENNFKRLERFLESCLSKSFCDKQEESSPVYDLILTVNNNAQDISVVKFLLLTDCEVSERAEFEGKKAIGQFEGLYDIWDLSRIFRIETSGKGREDVIVDFCAYEGHADGLPCLPAFQNSAGYKSYLMVVPGSILADIYDKFGERLLEQNVRTFLQFTGKVNKGLRNTIRNEPHMFFAYNNGLTATAESLNINESQNRVSSIKNLQVVNGGQTTAAIFMAMKKEKISLANVFVQVKLTLISEDKIETIVPKISEYANTQNKVNAADFYSNHPFHLRIQEISRRLRTRFREGREVDPHWYYERTRGQYSNIIARLPSAEASRFKLENPRNKVFTKTDLAKYEHSWGMLPHIVSLGAQKNFGKFSEIMAKRWEIDEAQFNEMYFKSLVAKAIIFKLVDSMVMHSDWYHGGYKANIVTYTMAKFANMLDTAGLILDMSRIWDEQDLSPTVRDQLNIIASMIYRKIQETPDYISNVTEWCKRPGCWDSIREMHVDLNDQIAGYCITLDEHESRNKDANRGQKMENGIDAERYVFDHGADHWKKLQEWNQHLNFFNIPKEIGILQTATLIPTKIPSDKQARILIDMEKRAVDEGWVA